MALPEFFRVQNDGVVLAVKLQPRASRNAIGEPIGAELRVWVSAPPVDSAANDALLRLLAETLGCARSQVELIRGRASRRKQIKLHGIAAEAAFAKLFPAQ